ncbi:MAG: hypothetical protein AMXMBFR7_46470 [Planctomycetota bacterium]
MRAILHLLLAALAVLAAGDSAAGERGGFDPSTLKPFTSGEAYEGRETGLYPGGKNEIPEAHRKAGEALAATIQPLDEAGKPDAANGRILALVAGHSNCKQYFTALGRHLESKQAELHPRFELLNGAVSGNQLPQLMNEQGRVWTLLNNQVKRPGYSPLQVQVLFLHTTYHGANNKGNQPAGPFPGEMQKMQSDLATVLGRCAATYPNLKLCYLTCDGFRHFTGQEPHVWREAFAFKWLIESQLKGDPAAAFAGPGRKLPWLQWGPYIWDNTWDRSYFADGVHPSPKALAIFVEKYWAFLSADPVTKAWLFKKP